MPAEDLISANTVPQWRVKRTPKMAMLKSRRSFGALLVLAALVTATAIVVPFYVSRYRSYPIATRLPKTHDMAQHLAVMEQFDKVLRAGSLYPRWLPDANNGYGLAWTNYYPPAFYYLTSLINLAVDNWVYTTFIVSALGLAASGLSFYIFSRQIYGRLPSAAGALLYLAAPYHVLDLYWRAALPEFMGFILVPAVVYFSFKLGTSGKAGYFAGLGFFHGLFLMTHFPVAYLMTYTLAFYAVSLAVTKRDWRIVFRIGSGIALALLIASIYWVPAALETKYVTEHFSRLFPYHESYITLLPAGPRLSEFAEFVALLNVSFTVQTVTLIAALCLLYSIGRSKRKSSQAETDSERRDRMHTAQWIAMAITTTFMATSLSVYISRLIPRIEAVSFPWRWMVIATFFTALVVAAAIDRLLTAGVFSWRISSVCRIAATAGIGLVVWYTIQGVILPTRSRQRLLPPPNFVESGFIPVGATQPQNLMAGPLASLNTAGEVEVIRWDPLHREVRLASTQPTILKLRTYNFPGWEARVDGQPAKILSDAVGGQVVNLDIPGEHTVEVFFVNTVPRSLGGALTGAGFLLICGLTGLDLVRRRRIASDAALRQEPVEDGALPAAPNALKDQETSYPLER